MGGGASIAGNNAKIVLKPLVEPEGLYYSLLEQKEFACIGYTDKELRKLAQLIQAFDPELKNQFSIKQFIKKACGMKRLNDITKRLFNVPLGQKDRILTFQEFILLIWRFLTLSTKELYEFTFELYDPEATGELMFGQVRSLIDTIHDSKLDSGSGSSNERDKEKSTRADKYNGSLKQQLGTFLDILGIHDEARITRMNFVGICEKFPMLVSPVQALQKSLKSAMYGDQFWSPIILFRLKSGPNAAAIHYDLLKATKAVKSDDFTYSSAETPRQHSAGAAKAAASNSATAAAQRSQQSATTTTTATAAAAGSDVADDERGSQRQDKVSIPGAASSSLSAPSPTAS